MANRVETQKLIDTNKRTLLKYTIFADGAATANASLIKFNELRFAMNANGAVSNTDPKANYGIGIRHIYGYSKIQNSAGYVTLKWENDANSEIFAFGTGSFDLDISGGSNSGDPAVIPSPAANAKGFIYSATSPTAGDVINLFIDIRKDSRDFDAGQSADPVAFNKNWSF
jgi:hypothetical protein